MAIYNAGSETDRYGTEKNAPPRGHAEAPERTMATDEPDRQGFTPNPGLTGTSGAAGDGNGGARTSFHQEAEQLRDKAWEKGAEFKERGRRKAEGILTGGKEKLAQGLENSAEAFRKMGDHFRDTRHAPMGDYAFRVSDGFDKASDYLSERSVKDISRDMETKARRQPLLVIGGAFLMGLVAARFIKSSRD